jgi:uncharacterized protein YoxC
MKNMRGQNIVEYILLVVAVLLVFLVILNPQSGTIKKSVETTINGTADQISIITSQIKFQ